MSKQSDFANRVVTINAENGFAEDSSPEVWAARAFAVLTFFGGKDDLADDTREELAQLMSVAPTQTIAAGCAAIEKAMALAEGLANDTEV